MSDFIICHRVSVDTDSVGLQTMAICRCIIYDIFPLSSTSTWCLLVLFKSYLFHDVTKASEGVLVHPHLTEPHWTPLSCQPGSSWRCTASWLWTVCSAGWPATSAATREKSCMEQDRQKKDRKERESGGGGGGGGREEESECGRKEQRSIVCQEEDVFRAVQCVFYQP